MKRLFLVGAPLILLSGCRVEPRANSSHLKASNLVGAYRMNLPVGDVQTLSLNKNGTLESRLVLKSGKVYKAKGRWRLSKEPDGDQRVYVDEVCILDNGKQSVCGGSYPLDDVNGTVIIVTDHIQNLLYVKE